MADLPEQTGPSIWDASLSADPSQWSRDFTDDELAALHAAALTVLAASPDASQDLSLGAVEAAAASLPAPLRLRLAALRDSQLLLGRGFFVLRGLPVAAWGDRLSAGAFLVLSRALGALRKQNAAGHVLGHVTDLGLSSADPSVRVYQTHERQTFHTDSCLWACACCARPRRGGSPS